MFENIQLSLLVIKRLNISSKTINIILTEIQEVIYQLLIMIHSVFNYKTTGQFAVREFHHFNMCIYVKITFITTLNKMN